MITMTQLPHVETVLACFPDATPTGDGAWAACCPCHSDRGKALAIATGDAGRLVLQCSVGCSVGHILAARGLSATDLDPPADAGRGAGSILDAAIEYARKGWPVFPIRARSKAPHARRGFKDASTDPDKVRAWWKRWPDANVGIATGHQSFGVVDLDVKNGTDGRETFKALCAVNMSNGEQLPDTLMAQTGSGGMHLCFAIPVGVEFRNTQGKLAKGIDTRGDGGYIVAPPSIHENGQAYQWLKPLDTPLAEIPAWLVPQGRPAPIGATPAARRRADLPADAVLDRASAYLATKDPAVQGCGGHSSLYAAATILVHGFDLSDHQAVALLESEYNPRCVPPWNLDDPAERKEFRRKVTEARAQSHDRPKGWLLGDNGRFDSGPGTVEHGARTAAALLAGGGGEPVEAPEDDGPLTFDAEWTGIKNVAAVTARYLDEEIHVDKVDLAYASAREKFARAVTACIDAARQDGDAAVGLADVDRGLRAILAERQRARAAGELKADDDGPKQGLADTMTALAIEKATQ